MGFSEMEAALKTWKEILVIGKNIERDNRRYHILGMTLADCEAKLYIVAPYSPPEGDRRKRKGPRNHRRMLKAVSYTHLIPGRGYGGGPSL